jgi:transposase
MQAITTIGLDIAKSVFQVHGIDATGNVILRRQLKRRYVLTFFQSLQPCLVGIEACASSHSWSRELSALGHTVRLMPAGCACHVRQPLIIRIADDSEQLFNAIASHRRVRSLEAARVHCPGRRRSGGMAACCPRAAGGDAERWIRRQRVTYDISGIVHSGDCVATLSAVRR